MDKENIINNFTLAIDYHEKKVNKEVGEIVDGNIGLNETTSEKAQYFDYVTSLNQKIKLKGFDIPFTFAKTDPITDEKMINILDDFKNDMSFNDRPYILYKHEDTEHLHYHLIISNPDWGGKPNVELSSFYRRKVTLLARNYEEKYGFRKLNEIGEEHKSKILKEVNSEKYAYQKAIKSALKNNDLILPSSVKEKISNENISNNKIKEVLGDNFPYVMKVLMKENYLKQSNKSLLIKELDKALSSINNNITPDKYFKALKGNNIYVRELKKTNPRLISYGIKIKDKIIYFKSDKLPERFSYKNLINNQETNYTVDKQKSFIKSIIGKGIKASTNYDDFKLFLKKNNVSIEEKRNDEFGIYALKYYSSNAKEPHFFNASQLDRSFSYSNLIKGFNNKEAAVSVERTKSVNIPTKDKNIEVANEKESSVSHTPLINIEDFDEAEPTGATKKAKIGKLDDDKKKKKGRSRG